MSDATQNKPQTSSQTAETQSVGNVESRIPGRTRVRVKSDLRTPQNMARLHEQFNSHPDVGQVTINQRTGSVTFTHGKDKDGGNIFEKILQEIELVAETVLEIPVEDDDGGSPEARLDQQLADLMHRVDYAIYQKTGLQAKGRVFPATIAGLGVAQLFIYGVSLEMLPGPVLIWIGWDIYHRFGKEPPFPPRTAAEATTPASDVAPQAADGHPALA